MNKTKVNIDEKKLEDTFLRVVDSIKSGELIDFEISQNMQAGDGGYCLIRIPKKNIVFCVNRYDSNNPQRKYLIYVSANANSSSVFSNSEDIENAFDYLSHRTEVEEVSLEDLLFNEE